MERGLVGGMRTGGWRYVRMYIYSLVKPTFSLLLYDNLCICREEYVNGGIGLATRDQDEGGVCSGIVVCVRMFVDNGQTLL